MTARNYFPIFVRIFFVLLSLKYLYDAFYKWDGYSYYLKFTEILPDFSLAFILWTVSGAVLALIFWLATYLTFRIFSGFIRAIHFEYILVWYIFIALIFFIRITYGFSFRNMGNLIGVGRFTVLIFGGFLVAFIVWLCHRLIEKHIKTVLLRIDTIIIPLVWIFSLLFILSIPFSTFLVVRDSHGVENVSMDVQSTHLNEKRPNIILVTMDALSAKDMHVYGYSRPTTPFIDKWSKNAVLFKRAYSSSNWTPPTTMTMMTGQRPWTHKNWFLSYMYPYKRYEKNLPKLLKENGYATYAFVQNFNAHPDALGIEADFLIADKYYTFFSRPPGFEGRLYRFINYLEEITNSRIAINWIIKKHPLFAPLWLFYPTDTNVTQIPPENVYNRFLEYISRDAQQPFFAWLHTEAPHYPFLPPKPYMGMFGDGDRYNTRFKQIDSNFFHRYYEPERQKEVDILKKRLDEYILYTDQQFKAFLSKLEELVDMSNTIIILSADHGTSVGRGFVGHGKYRLYETITHIPLIIKMPDQNNQFMGREIDIPVEQVDIAPTILEFAGIPTPEWMEGRSLVPLIEGKPVEPRPVFSMELGQNRALGDHPLTKYSIAVWDGFYKLIYYEGWEGKETELYDLSSDPGETQNIINERPEIGRRLINLIEKNLSKAMNKQYILRK